MKFFHCLCLFVLFVAINLPAHATKRALLIGVGHFDDRNIPRLKGPVPDVEALQQVLVKRWGFAAENLAILTDQQATKQGILTALDQLVKVSRPGDFVLFYFSGHGTSRFDSQFGLSALPHTTGALIPYDLKLAANDKISQLLVGKTDLRPRLQKLDDNGVSGLAIIDSCYSGNAVRSISRTVSRHVAMSFTSRALPGDSVFLDDDDDEQAEGEDAYPYKKIAFISASSDKEVAAEEQHPDLTHDGKPHGVLTDNLLQVLTGKFNADGNNDGRVTNWELYTAVKASISEKQRYPQSPQFLPLMTAAGELAVKTEVFTEQAPPSQELGKQNFGIQVNGALPTVSTTIKHHSRLHLADNAPDRIIAKQQGEYVMLTASHEVLSRSDTEKGIAKALVWQPQLHDLVYLRNRLQQFSVKIVPTKASQGETYVAGDILAFDIALERDAWLLILSLSADGRINVLYPYEAAEMKMVKKDKKINFGNVKVEAPFGIDYVMTLAFLEKPSQLENYRRLAHGAGIYPDAAEHMALVKTIMAQSRKQSRQAIKIVTLAQ